MAAEPVRIDERDAGDGLPEGFLELPPLVYQDDPHWLPEEPARLHAMFSPMNPWFRHGRARLFSMPGQARAAAFLEPAARVDGEPVAFFGCWETRASAADDARLLDAVTGWARGQGVKMLVGPIDFSTMGSYRLLLAAEPGMTPFQGEPYNPLDYAQRLERCGFSLVQRYHSWLYEGETTRRLLDYLAPRHQKLLDEGYTFSPLTSEYWMANLAAIHQQCNAIFADNLGFVPVTAEEFAIACGPSYIRKACPIASVVAHDRAGEVVGFFLVFPDYGPIACAGAGADRVPLSALDYAKHLPRLHQRGPLRGLTKTVGVLPDRRIGGLFYGLLAETAQRGAELYPAWIGSLIREGNPSQRSMDHARSICLRTYGLFGRPV